MTCWPRAPAYMWQLGVSTPAGHSHSILHRLLIRVWETPLLLAGLGFLSEPKSAGTVGPDTGREGKGMVPPLPFPKPLLHTDPTAPLRTEPPCYNGLRRSEQLPYKSLFIGISSNFPIPELHLNQLRKRERRRKEAAPPPSSLSEKQFTTSFIW